MLCCFYFKKTYNESIIVDLFFDNKNMKKFFTIFIVLVAGFLPFAAVAQTPSPSATASPTPTLTPSPTPTIVPVPPILKGIGLNELRQEISIKEIRGLKICQELNRCPFSDNEKPYIEVLIKMIINHGIPYYISRL